METERPDWRPSWPEVPEGHEVVAIIDPDWEAESGRPCSYVSGPSSRRVRCGKPAVATFLRGYYRKQRFRYCPDHMYGRWVESGFVMHWILAKVGNDA
jgi:hypothetical protein